MTTIGTVRLSRPKGRDELGERCHERGREHEDGDRPAQSERSPNTRKNTSATAAEATNIVADPARLFVLPKIRSAPDFVRSPTTDASPSPQPRMRIPSPPIQIGNRAAPGEQYVRQERDRKVDRTEIPTAFLVLHCGEEAEEIAREVDEYEGDRPDDRKLPAVEEDHREDPPVRDADMDDLSRHRRREVTATQQQLCDPYKPKNEAKRDDDAPPVHDAKNRLCRRICQPSFA